MKYYRYIKRIFSNDETVYIVTIANMIFVEINLVNLIIFKGEKMEFTLSVIASVVAAIIAGIAGYLFRGVTFRKKLMSAPEKYVNHIDKLITSATNSGKEAISVNAQAIVSTRDDLQSSLSALSKLLNSDIDRMKEILKRDGNKDALYEVAQVLEKKWPAKKDQIKVEIDKLISELGLREIV